LQLLDGTDTAAPWIVPGASLHHELTLLAEAGIPPLKILKNRNVECGARAAPRRRAR